MYLLLIASLLYSTCDGFFDFGEGSGYDPDVNLDTPDMIVRAGYSVEEHVISTEDGYLLTLHRIPKVNAPPVLLQHGLLGSSADWVVIGKEKALAYMLADEFDVWLGNFRGNTYSRAHKTLPSTDCRFWNFTWNEMGIYDLPATVTYIANRTKKKVLYVGHSMGTTSFFVMASQRSQVANRIQAMIALAPVAFMSRMKSPIRLLAPYVNDVQFVIRYLGNGEFLPQNGILKFLARYGCEVDAVEEKICENAIFVLCGFDKYQFNKTLLPVILSHTPAGTSTKTMIHFGQEVTSGHFRHYDYGETGNVAIYNQTSPPDYDVSNVDVPTALIYANNDWFANPKDVQKLYNLLPRKRGLYKVNFLKFSHLDFIWGIDVRKLVYEKVSRLLRKFAGPL